MSVQEQYVMKDIISFSLTILAAMVLYFINVTVINAFASWVYSQPIGWEGKVVIGIIAAVAEAGEIISLLSLLKFKK